ncbi:MAG: CPBP family intramembrane metalloprotease [Deltaproteobacteria bacterium]|nr:CPBP family intramembrane metalloprotease [Deltaproteobacteria bacterium]
MIFEPVQQPALTFLACAPLAARCCTSLLVFLCLGVLPALIIKLGLKEDLAKYGITFGDRLQTARSLLIFTPFMVLSAYIGSQDTHVSNAYALHGCNTSASALLLLLLLFCRILFCAGWEFFFRGFLQTKIAAWSTPVVGVLIQTGASTLAHLGDPPLEFLGAAAAGLLWGMLRLHTHSIISSWLQHSLLGFALDLFLLKT